MVLGEGTRESEAPGKRPAETAKKVTENAVLAKTVHPATLRPIKTFKIQPEGGEGKKSLLGHRIALRQLTCFSNARGQLTPPFF